RPTRTRSERARGHRGGAPENGGDRKTDRGREGSRGQEGARGRGGRGARGDRDCSDDSTHSTARGDRGRGASSRGSAGTTPETAVQPEPVVAEPAAEVEQESSPGMKETVEAPSVEEEPMGEEPVSDSPQAVPTETAETRPLQEPVVEPVETPVFVSVSETQQAISVAPAIEPTRALHPCPTCGRELTYIARYRRWYCYHCPAYAPLSESKFPCPTCGAALRWIGQY